MKHLTTPCGPVSPAECAREAGLRYITDNKRGFTRRKRGDGVVIAGLDGKMVRDPAHLARIKRLAIPPAWTDVWISPIPNGHLQATGHDVRGRKQYRYHPDWRSARDTTKYGRMMAFGRALPAIRKKIDQDLKLPGLPREKVLATVVRLLEMTLIRVGNDQYARENQSYGLTTMLDRHARIKGHTVTFEFKGKSGIRHKVDVRDPQLAKMVKRCQDLPGQEIFQYLDGQGQVQDVGSHDVNEYLRSIAGEEFTAKDFRTWSGTVLAALALREFEPFTSGKEAKKNILQAIEAVARMLGNTPAICKRCYVHPVVLDSYMEGATIATLQKASEQKLANDLHSLKPEEAAVLTLLQQRLAEGIKESPDGTLARNLATSVKTSRTSRRAKPAGTRSRATAR